ncbi:hypothetical protein ACKWTF_006861 [Chironomus riparius]
MKDDKILLIPSEESYKHHHHHLRKRFFLIGAVFLGTIFISCIIILGSSLGIHQKSSLIHGNNIINSSIIINIIVDGGNRNRSLIDELMDDSDSDYDIQDNENKPETDIFRGPLRVEHIDQIPILRDMFEMKTTMGPEPEIIATTDTDSY